MVLAQQRILGIEQQPSQQITGLLPNEAVNRASSIFTSKLPAADLQGAGEVYLLGAKTEGVAPGEPCTKA